MRPARLTLDRAVAARVGAGELATAFDAGALIAAAEADETTATAASLGATHFP